MNYGIAEQEIVTRLNAHFQKIGMSDFFVSAVMPETEAEAKDYESLYPKSRVAVEYIDGNYEAPDSLGIVKQNETAKFRLLFESKKMRGNNGLYSMIEQTKLSLIGFRLSNADPLYLNGYGKQQYESGVWLPYLDFECKTLNVQAFDNDSEIIGGYLVGLLDAPLQFTNEIDEKQFL